jgi:sodium/bile acid cotransporter 7
MVLIGAVTASGRLQTSDGADALGSSSVLTMILVTLALHVVALAIGFYVAKTARLDRANQIAVAIAGSQKTLMVGLYIAVNYFGGATILPMISYHVGQLFLDTVFADLVRGEA